MATENLSPAGSSSYSSSTMYVGDGTWDSTRNDFLLPNLMGLNFETMRYNGMGNRFAGMPGYYGLILGHAILAVITFLFVVPAAIMIARFYGRSPRMALRVHIYLQILTVALTTVVFVLGWFAVGPLRKLTNPHHGIGLAIYVLVLVQAVAGACIHSRERKKARTRIPFTLYLHQWIGRATALLGIAQVALGLTLYGSPKWTFILYAIWVAFLVLLFFVYSFRARASIDRMVRRESSHGGTVISDKRSSRFGGIVAPLAAGAGAAALLSGRRRSRSRSRSHSRSRREEVVPSRRGSGTYIEDEKFDHKKKGGGMMDTFMKAAAAVGAAGLAKSWYERKQNRRDDVSVSEYTSVAPETPSRRPSRRHQHTESVYTDATRLEEGRRPHSPLLPGDPSIAAAALSAAEARPTTARPVRPQSRSSYTSYTDSYTNSDSPSRRPQENHGVGKGILAGLGLGWFAKKMADRREKKEVEYEDGIHEEKLEDEKQKRQGGSSRYTGDGFGPSRKQQRQPSTIMSSDLSSIIPSDPHQIRPGSSIPPIPTSLTGGAASPAMSPVQMPHAPPDPQGILHQSESGSEAYVSNGGPPLRRPSERRRRQGDAAAAEAVAAAAELAKEEEARRRRSRNRTDTVNSPVSVKVKVHGDNDRHVTLRRLTQEEAEAERAARGTSKARKKRADSMSDLSGTDTGADRRRYRRAERAAEKIAEKRAESAPTTPLEPPSTAGGRRAKDSAYYSGKPGDAFGVGGTSIASRESHGTWSEMSPSGAGIKSEMGASADERRRRRRQERNRKSGGPTSTVEFS
ncbi:hypothetical protein HYALB_00011203 [Hymenoscyphus albidus]|uniref:Cytochrome b561 domain-containing protein n=1 Tax=Hymenoscyphus albidus TaxID=595503 RepID=A0A9N9LME8_9HELO|nr:hypothetical protein HYALB_00011203 [Hymenoscyphus albidus]